VVVVVVVVVVGWQGEELIFSFSHHDPGHSASPALSYVMDFLRCTKCLP
jgi:hypothetical protein